MTQCLSKDRMNEYPVEEIGEETSTELRYQGDHKREDPESNTDPMLLRRERCTLNSDSTELNEQDLYDDDKDEDEDEDAVLGHFGENVVLYNND